MPVAVAQHRLHAALAPLGLPAETMVVDIDVAAGPAFVAGARRSFQPPVSVSDAVDAVGRFLVIARGVRLGLADGRDVVARLDEPGPRAWVSGRPTGP